MPIKLPKLICSRTAFYFSEGWEVIWHPDDASKPRETFGVSIRHHHDRGGDSASYSYIGPASINSSLHLIKLAIKNKVLPK